MDKTLKEWRDRIASEAPNVGILPYSHNMISICLNAISKKWGVKEVEKAIVDFGLKAKGWRKVKKQTAK